MKIIKESTEKYTLNEAGLSRILQHATDDITFAVIGSQDKDTKRSRWYELRGLVQDVAQKALKNDVHIGWNELEGTYTYDDGEVGVERSLIIYNIPKSDALRIAKELNQESIIWKDNDFFGFLKTDGTKDGELGRGLSFDKEAAAAYGSKLIGKHNNAKKFVYEAYIVESTNRGSNFSRHNSANKVRTLLFRINNY